MHNRLTPLFLLGLLVLMALCHPMRADDSTSKPQTVRVMQFNIWQEGTKVPGGLEKIAAAILAAKADVVTFSEIRNYKRQDWTTKLLAELKKQDPAQTFDGKFIGGDVGLVSRFPIASSQEVFNETKADQGSILAWTLSLPGGRSLIVASAHLDYQHYALNWVRGYQGGNKDGWSLRPPRADGSPDRITDVTALQKYNNESHRDEAIAAFIAFAKSQQEKLPHTPIILGGDFNEGSHLDWTDRTKDLFDHHGVILPWDNSLALKAAGFVDAYRRAHPDEVEFPGLTWPATAFGAKTTSWATTADERDRIDFIYTGPGLHTAAAFIAGPTTCFVGETKTANPGKDEFLAADLDWPSDHKAVLADVVVE